MEFSRPEPKDNHKRKGLIMTFVFHGIALLLVLIPLLDFDEKEPEIQAVVVEFNSSSKKSKGAKKEKREEKQERREVKQVESISKPAQKMITSTEPNEVKVPKVNRPSKTTEKIADRAPSDVLSTRGSHNPNLKPAKISSPKPIASSGGDASSASGKGEADTGEGSSDAGDSEDDGTGFIAGDGILDRRIVKRAPIDALVKESGTIVIKLCVTRSGVVDYVEYDSERSSIQNNAVAQEAVSAIRKYIFEDDPTAAKRECGSFQFNIDIK